jgi:hypothetical protein
MQSAMAGKTKAPNTGPGALANLFPFAGIAQIKFLGFISDLSTTPERLTHQILKFSCRWKEVSVRYIFTPKKILSLVESL